MKCFILIFVLLNSLAALSGTSSIVGQLGYLNLLQDAALKEHVRPAGTSYAIGFTNRNDYIEFEATYLQAKAESEIRHDDISNSLVHKQSSILLNLNFYIFKNLYARGGIGLHKIKQSLAKPMSEASTEGARRTYGIKESEYSQGLLLGVGVLLIETRSTNIFIQFDKMTFPTIHSAAWNAAIGFRYYLN